METFCATFTRQKWIFHPLADTNTARSSSTHITMMKLMLMMATTCKQSTWGLGKWVNTLPEKNTNRHSGTSRESDNSWWLLQPISTNRGPLNASCRKALMGIRRPTKNWWWNGERTDRTQVKSKRGNLITPSKLTFKTWNHLPKNLQHSSISKAVLPQLTPFRSRTV